MTLDSTKPRSDALFGIVGHFVLGADCVRALRRRIPARQLANYPINRINSIIPAGAGNYWINRINRTIGSMAISDREVGSSGAGDIGIYPLTGIRVCAYEFPLTVVCENAYELILIN